MSTKKYFFLPAAPEVGTDERVLATRIKAKKTLQNGVEKQIAIGYIIRIAESIG